MSISIPHVLQGLPEDPLDAVAEAIDRLAPMLSGGQPEDFRVALAIIQKLGAKLEVTIPKPTPGMSLSDVFTICRGSVRAQISSRRVVLAEQEVEEELEKIMSLRSDEPGFAILSGEEKSDIAAKIEFIRQIIERSELNVRKKNVLFKKLNKFSAEVMKDGTDTDTLFAFFGELSLNAGLMAKNAKPALDELKQILRIVFRNRAKREGLPLPSPEDLLQLPDMSNE